ncbi:tRNA 2-thiouridine(34) synthase MnmA [Buchnera aphidicola]|uniref:tRNA 2-thiouridine(34) synthase MnmA n=1 Tax=Buchnera aphidicola TaxID=9 RepID=UPI003464C5FA
MNSKNIKKVIVAMSGGVDSSVAAYILLQQGYIVEGMFMKNWEEDDTIDYCASSQDLNDTRAVCKKLKIYLHEVNFSEEYWNDVFKKFLFAYKTGITPNPDIWCNKYIKFKIFLNVATKLFKADYIATGHYAQIKYFNHKPMLIRGIDVNKDQSYFLYTLNHKKLKKILFPIGKFQKKKVRNIARELNLSVAEKPDSTGICFIGSYKIQKFLSRFITSLPGNILTDRGYIIGKHSGIINYTIGQRKGLGIGGKYGKKNIPWYVCDKNLFLNTITVVQGFNHHKLMSIGLIADKVNWINSENISNILNCTAKVRYRQIDVPCIIILKNLKSIKIFFKNPVFGVTPGQSVVFYSCEICIGGGIIKKSIPFLNK